MGRGEPNIRSEWRKTSSLPQRLARDRDLAIVFVPRLSELKRESDLDGGGGGAEALADEARVEAR